MRDPSRREGHPRKGPERGEGVAVPIRPASRPQPNTKPIRRRDFTPRRSFPIFIFPPILCIGGKMGKWKMIRRTQQVETIFDFPFFASHPLPPPPDFTPRPRIARSTASRSERPDGRPAPSRANGNGDRWPRSGRPHRRKGQHRRSAPASATPRRRQHGQPIRTPGRTARTFEGERTKKARQN